MCVGAGGITIRKTVGVREGGREGEEREEMKFKI